MEHTSQKSQWMRSADLIQCGMQGRCQQKQHELEAENGQLKQARLLLVGNEYATSELLVVETRLKD